MNITISKPYAISEKGLKIDNEDVIYPSPEVVTSSQQLFLVCDGFGAPRGEVAGALVCEHFQTFFATMLEGGEPSCDFIRKAIQYTEAGFDAYVNEHPEAKGMSSTLAMLYIGNSGVTVANAGNSYIYQFRDGKIIYRAEDHEQDAIQSSSSHVEAGVSLLKDIQAGDYFFICTDGVMENLSGEKLSAIFGKRLPPEIIKDEIVEQCDGKTRDNYSFYIIPVQSIQESTSYKQNILSFLYSFI